MLYRALITFIAYTSYLPVLISAAQILRFGPCFSLSQIFPSPNNISKGKYSEVVSRGDFYVFAGSGGLQLVHSYLFHSFEYTSEIFRFQELVTPEFVVRNLSTRIPSLNSDNIRDSLIRTQIFSFALVPETGAIYAYQNFIEGEVEKPFYKCHVAETSVMRAMELLHWSWHTPLNNSSIGTFSYVVCAYTIPNELLPEIRPEVPVRPVDDHLDIQRPEDQNSIRFEVDRVPVSENQEIAEAIIVRSKNGQPPHTQNGEIFWSNDSSTIKITQNCLEVETDEMFYRFTPHDGQAMLNIKSLNHFGYILHFTATAESFSYLLEDHKPGNHFCVLVTFSSNQDGHDSTGKVNSLLELIRDGHATRFVDFDERDLMACVKTKAL